jgi:hypothetical protein
MSAMPRPASPSHERAWLLRALLVLQSPRPVFAALRDDSDAAARARQEPVLALVGLAGIAGVLWTPVAGRLLDDPVLDAALVAVWAFLGGMLYGAVLYFLGGAFLFLGARAAGSLGGYRRARHVLGFAVAPVALSLLVWPFRLAVFGADNFRTGGADERAAATAFDVAFGVFVVWSLALLVYGISVVERWRIVRAAVSLVLVVLGLVVFTLAVLIPLSAA